MWYCCFLEVDVKSPLVYCGLFPGYSGKHLKWKHDILVKKFIGDESSGLGVKPLEGRASSTISPKSIIVHCSPVAHGTMVMEKPKIPSIMKAVRFHEHGKPEVLQLETEVPVPEIKPTQVSYKIGII